jgi:uncharacterized membrane protein
VTGAPRRRVALALGLVLCVSFAVMAHLAITSGFGDGAVGASLSLVPVAAIAIWAMRRSRRPLTALVAIVAAAVALGAGWPVLERHFQSVFFVEHATTNLALATVFGRTLVADREALCTRFARLLHGALPIEVERYTRQVTLAWTLFFALVFTLSCVLYLGGFLEAWSLLANVLGIVLIAAMFVVEYAVRLRVLPNWQRTGILEGIRAFARHVQVSQPKVLR